MFSSGCWTIVSRSHTVTWLYLSCSTTLTPVWILFRLVWQCAASISCRNTQNIILLLHYLHARARSTVAVSSFSVRVRYSQIYRVLEKFQRLAAYKNDKPFASLAHFNAEYGVQVRGVNISSIHAVSRGHCSAPNNIPIQRHEGVQCNTQDWCFKTVEGSKNGF